MATRIRRELKAYCSKDSIASYHVDFEKNLPAPKLAISESYYCRNFYTYGLGIYSAYHKKTAMIMYPEYVGHKTANDIISLLNLFFTSHRMGRTGCKHLIIYCDNCSNNKNHAIMQYCDFLVSAKMFDTVQVKYLVSGHSFGPADRTFAKIELAGRFATKLYCPDDWIDLVEGLKGIGGYCYSILSY